MAKQATPMKKTRTRYSDAYYEEALALADQMGTAAAARELGLKHSQLYKWRPKAQQKKNTSEHEQSLADENARLSGTCGYYAWRQRSGKPSPRRRQQVITDQCVALAFQQQKGRSGVPKLTNDLNDADVAICRNTVAASLRR